MAPALVWLGLAGCGGGDDGGAVPGPDGGNLSGTDGGGTDGGGPDAPGGGCHPLELTAQQACAVSYTGTVTPCSMQGGMPSVTGYLEVRRPDGTKGYLCSNRWVDPDGFYFSNDRLHLAAAASACCDATGGAPLDWPAADGGLGAAHGPTRVKPQELATDTGGALRSNPFQIVVSSAAVGATVHDTVAMWTSWIGDGQAHQAPDGTGGYYFPPSMPINYTIVPTTRGAPLIVIGPEVATDVSFRRELGHPTLGGCPDGGAPLGFLGGTLEGTKLTNRSGRYGAESTVTPATLDAAAALFNCYGVAVDDVEFVQQ
ncbi:MAG TPA: hypothetical protein VHE35_23270 [Kofleriaceae bacterium]|nr:hypothetical protein [Kofleriaceae bacterium]